MCVDAFIAENRLISYFTTTSAHSSWIPYLYDVANQLSIWEYCTGRSHPLRIALIEPIGKFTAGGLQKQSNQIVGFAPPRRFPPETFRTKPDKTKHKSFYPPTPQIIAATTSTASLSTVSTAPPTKRSSMFNKRTTAFTLLAACGTIAAAGLGVAAFNR